MAEDKIAWIRARLERTGKPQKVIGDIIGRDAGVVSRIMSGARKLTIEEWDKIRSHFEGDAGPAAEPERTSDEDLRMPIYGSARGGLDGDFIDTLNPIGWRPVPYWMLGVQSPAAIRISGESMEPRYFNGELLWADPSKPVRRKDFVLLEFKDGRGLIKRYLGPKGDAIEVEQLNPAKRLFIPKDELRRVVRIAGTLEE
jgi:phage repressor protein C with HTH and peptisase S24 domain